MAVGHMSIMVIRLLLVWSKFDNAWHGSEVDKELDLKFGGRNDKKDA